MLRGVREGPFCWLTAAMMVGFQFDAISAAIFFEAKKNHGLRTPFRPEVAWREIFLGQPTKSRTQQWQGAKKVDVGFGSLPHNGLKLDNGGYIHFESLDL